MISTTRISRAALLALVLAGCSTDEGPELGVTSVEMLDSGDAAVSDTGSEPDAVEGSGSGSGDTVESDAGSGDTEVADTTPDDTEVADTTPDDTEGSADTTPPAPRACDSWLECAHGQGCDAGFCGGCAVAADCPDLLGCTAEGLCGACALDADCRAGESCTEGVCLPTVISEVRVTVDAADYRALRADRYNPDLTVPCTVAADGIAYTGPTTLAVHGGSSRDLPKLSFVVETAAAEHPGYAEKMVLRAEYNDASSLRNLLGMELFRRSTDLPTPRTRFRRLYINDAFFGLMVEIERIGSDFLDVRGRDSAASMYESDPPNAIASNGAGSLVPLPDAALYAQAYDQKTGSVAGAADAIYFIEQVLQPDYIDGQLTGNFLNRTRRQLHLNGYIDYLAVNAILQNKDHVRKNFYFSRQIVDGRIGWEFYPWDLDLTQGCLYGMLGDSSICGAPVYDDTLDNGLIEPDSGLTYPTDGFYNLLMHNVQADEFGGATAYREAICARIASPLYTDGIPTLARTLGAYIRPVLVEDTADRNGTAEDHIAAVEEVVGFYAERAAFISAALNCP